MHRCRYCSHESGNRHQLAAHMRVCVEWKLWRASNLTKETLQRLYVDDGRSMPEIVEMLNLPSVSVVYNDLKRYEIPVRGIADAEKMPRKRQRQHATCIRKWGATNPLAKGTEPRRRMEEKLFRERGVTNVFQLPEVILKIRDTLVSRPESITSRFSTQHREVIEFIWEYGFTDASVEHRIAYPRGYRSYDVKVGNKLIEIHGDYWHANPKTHNPDDVIVWSMGEMTAQQVWARDEFKRALAETSGFELLVVWESDWKMCRKTTERSILVYLGHA